MASGARSHGAALVRPTARPGDHRRRRLPDDVPGAHDPGRRIRSWYKIALLDNKKLGMIRQWQEMIYGGNYHSASLLGPDFV